MDKLLLHVRRCFLNKPGHIMLHLLALITTLASYNVHLNIEILCRTSSAWLKPGECLGILCDKRILNHFKSAIYTTVLRPVSLYSTESCPTTKRQETCMHIMEKRMISRVTRIGHMPNMTLEDKYDSGTSGILLELHRLVELFRCLGGSTACTLFSAHLVIDQIVINNSSTVLP